VSTQLSPGAQTIEDRRTQTTDEGDHERFSHYAEKDKITEAMVTGTPITALCGKVWVPSRDPKRFPVCPTCKELYDMGPEGRMRFWRERAGGGDGGTGGEQ